MPSPFGLSRSSSYSSARVLSLESQLNNRRLAAKALVFEALSNSSSLPITVPLAVAHARGRSRYAVSFPRRCWRGPGLCGGAKFFEKRLRAHQVPRVATLGE